ncbi:hypothetical protein [Enterovibrio calviensis]|uniref:hypothetical protein n=1 Tax=Enterovibrio calviensis TaxID=91359 RepID=UPI000A5D30F4|nr:hypothetical protein [Enterovibrio calviensis]
MLELREEGRNPEIALTGETDFVTLKNCVDYWLENKGPQLKPGARQLYHSFADNYYHIFQDVDVERIPAREWMKWFDEIAKKNPKTANSAFSKLRTCFNYCKSKFMIDGTHLEKIRQQDAGAAPVADDRVLSLPDSPKFVLR